MPTATIFAHDHFQHTPARDAQFAAQYIIYGRHRCWHARMAMSTTRTAVWRAKGINIIALRILTRADTYEHALDLFPQHLERFNVSPLYAAMYFTRHSRRACSCPSLRLRSLLLRPLYARATRKLHAGADTACRHALLCPACATGAAATPGCRATRYCRGGILHNRVNISPAIAFAAHHDAACAARYGQHFSSTAPLYFPRRHL